MPSGVHADGPNGEFGDSTEKNGYAVLHEKRPLCNRSVSHGQGGKQMEIPSMLVEVRYGSRTAGNSRAGFGRHYQRTACIAALGGMVGHLLGRLLLCCKVDHLIGSGISACI